MPRNLFQTNPAPLGMDTSSDPTLLPPQKCQRLVNFRANRMGRLRACLKLSDIAAMSADGIAAYYGETAEDDRLLVVVGGNLMVGTPSNLSADVPTWNFLAVGTGFETGKAVRSVSYGTETFFVQEGGIQPLRYDGTGLYQVGIAPPSSAPTVLTANPTSGSDNKAGTILYSYSYFDSRYRESDVSDDVSVNYNTTANTGKCGFVQIGWGSDPQVFGAYIYATTSGGTTAYRIGTLLKSSGSVQIEDNFADSIVSAGAQSPHAGQYAIPNEASCIAVHKRHLVMNDTTDVTALQINNLDAPTQWASVTTLATDGVRMAIGTHEGAGITSLSQIGSLLMVGTRKEILQLWGDAPTGSSTFQLRALHGVGVMAPGSIQWCSNVIVALATDGKVRTTGGEDTFLSHVISQDIEAELRGHTPAQMEAAVSEYIEDMYLLAIGNKIYGFDFSSGGAWTIIDVNGL